MTRRQPITEPPGRGPLRARLRVLVVDDSRVQRRILAVSLRRRGYAVTEAGSGEEALRLCRETPFDMLLSDWVMPGMSGPELCRAFRALPEVRYGYVILLTAKSDKNEITAGLEAGADDFLAKPADPQELHARLAAGERILAMAGKLREQNRLVAATLSELQGLYGALERDLQEARRLQESLVPSRYRDFGAAAVSVMLRPSGHVGGDLVGFFPITPSRIGLFAIDVSGHGVASAITAARLSGIFSPAAPERNLALRKDIAGRFRARPPHEVAALLNAMILDDIGADQYLTLLYADLDLASGRVGLVQAGHPHPALCRAHGQVQWLGRGGLPVGLLEGATYETVRLRLRPGDRLVLVSDGVTECTSADRQQYGKDGIRRLLATHGRLEGAQFLDALVTDLQHHAGKADFDDDISAIMVDYRGPR